ncbi:glycosyl transferase [Malaciobacter molluscorum]|uniref:glycosyltransferase n=1 Tax=Malaciobacter molluscorum TaxID=1032072 RepID=UPI00100C35D1|nr:glycosyltransferase [Malaciobacter molluscorum]RXJ96220.1 glycosyl transferase [Malaciobacter molluscorum]
MKIAYISRSIIPSRTANSIHVMKMCNAFASLGHEVILLAPWTKKLEEKNVSDIFEYYGVEKNFELKKVFSPNIKYLKKRIYSYRCLNIVKKINPDIVYGRDDMFAFYLTQKSGYFTLFEKHEPYNEKGVNNFFFDKFMKNNTNNLKLVVNSNELRKMYNNSCNISLDSILAANNATNKIPDEKVPTNIDIDNTKIQIGYVGSLFKGRGIDIIIQLAQKIPNAIFHIIGGKQKDIDYWKDKNKLSNIIFHGFVEPKETYKYRNMCDILLAPYQSDEEGNRSSKYMSPIKLYEYMSSKKAIVCSNFKVVYEALNDECALLVDSSDITAWENAVNELISNKEKREKLALTAYEKFIKYHTWKARAKKIIDSIDQSKSNNI